MRLRVSALLCGCLFIIPAIQSQTRSVLESDPQGWINLLADKTMRDWVRGPLAATGQLRAGSMSEPSPWKLDPSGTILVCEGERVGHEWIRYAPELTNCVLHADWRCPQSEGQKTYNSGLFVRTGIDGVIWHQAQCTPGGGYLFGNTLVNGVPQRVNLREKMSENRVKPAGEWNTYELRASGKQLTLWVNGAVVNEFNDCEVPRGYAGLEAEGYRVEFRNVMLKK